MSSNSLNRWLGERAEALDEIENAHLMVGGSERGRRYATQQINFAYATLLSSHFQGFCRDLHSECIDHIVATAPLSLQELLGTNLSRMRSLDRGNPHPGAISSDFTRLGIDMWTSACAMDTRNHRRRELLQELVEWRNAIAHQDFNTVASGGIPTLHLAKVKAWRSAINALARYFEQAAYNHLTTILRTPPW